MEGRGASAWSLVALALAGAAFLLLLSAPAGLAAGLWDLRFGFTLLRWAAYAGVPAVLVALAAVVHSLLTTRGRSLSVSVVALVLGFVAAGFPLRQYQIAQTFPPINDITTDPADPPAFTVAGRGDENGAAGAPYPGTEFAEQQRAAYPDLETLRFALPPAETFRAALATARDMPGWEVVLADSAGGRIEATATTRWFRFKDDVAIRVRPAGSGSAVDVRSRSRVGQSDVGANAERIRDFRERLKKKVSP